MSRDLPEPERSSYDRPNQPWVCGHAAEGDPCAFGPGNHGVCPALAECKPVEISGEWRCDRPATRGGPCDDGPTTDGQCCRSRNCRPVRSLRSKRGIVVRSAMVFAVGAVLMMLGGSYRNSWIAPGPLCSHHAQVLQGKAWDNRCTSCHAAAEQPLGSWLASVVGAKLGPPQTAKCLACHDKSIDPDLALLAHNVPAAYLTSLRQPGSNNVSVEESPENVQSLACSVCHQEHHGAEYDLAAMDNARCQSCHTQQFTNFADDHPDFGAWPFRRRTRIIFQHTTHQAKHFAEKGREFACRQCHVEDSAGNVQLTLGYDAACAECHDTDIAASTAGGMAVLSLPTLDTEWMQESGQLVEDWPQRATGDFDGRPPAIMKLLLAGDPDARAALATLGEDVDFFDVDPDDDSHIRASAQIASAIHRLLDRLEVDSEDETPTLRGLTADVVAQARRAWQSDVADSALEAARPGTWWSDDVSLSLRYQPTGHDDPLLKAWFDAVVALQDGPLRETLLNELAGSSGPGRCTMCHSIEWSPGPSNGTRSLHINWRAHDRRSEPRGFTRFSHAPHLLPAELRDCTACHSLDPAASTAASYTGFNPLAYSNEFAPLDKATCAACHRPGAVSDRCTDCHNYHVQWRRN